MKKLMVLIGFLVVAGVGGWVWYGSVKEEQEIVSKQSQQASQGANDVQNQQEIESSSKWKTYRNEEFGIEFQYPENMFLLDEIVYAGRDSLEITLREKGYSIRDLDHRVDINIHALKSDKEYSWEKETDAAFISIPFSPGQGKWTMDTWKSDVSTDRDRWMNFVEKGQCGGFSIHRDTEQYYRDYLTIQCKEEDSLGSIYRDIYRSIRIFDAETSSAIEAAEDVRI